MTRFAVLSVLFLPLCACSSRGGSGTEPAPPAGASATTSATNQPITASPVRASIDLVDMLSMCDVEHRGLLFDAGGNGLLGRLGWDLGRPRGIEQAEHGGATWARITQRSLPITFVLPEAARIFVSTRALGKTARSASVYLDDQPLGTLTFSRAEPKVATTNTTTLAADAGLHTISLRFGRAREGDPFVDIDWIRVGIPDESPVTFGALTARDLIVPNAALSAVPHRAVALRAPGSFRCTLRPAPSSVVEVSAGMSSAGEGSVSLVVARDGHKPEVIARSKITGGDKGTWADMKASLAPFANQVVTLSLVAERAPKGVRVLFGDPRIVDSKIPAPPVSPARAVVVVVLSGIERPDLPPWGQVSADALPTLSDLAQNATTFDAHRAPSTVISANVASLLTGLSPTAHTLTDPAMRLPDAQTTVAEIARDAAVRTGMFTGVPLSFRAFGFAQGWEKWFEHPPASGDAATLPFDAAATWIGEVAKSETPARLFAVIHSRGGHPPWEVTPKELSQLEPKDYSGLIEPRRAGQTIAKARKKKNRDVLTQVDRDRMRVLQMLALQGQDRALGNVVTALKTAGIWEQTLFIVTGDVSSGTSMNALFGDALPLSEPLLSLPLYVHFPGGAHSGVRVESPTEVIDVTRTIFEALGLDRGKRAGRDLSQVAIGTLSSPTAPQIAMLDTTYSARWGQLILTGRAGAPPSLCDLSLDPSCAVNRREAMPMAAHALFRLVVAADLAAHSVNEQRELAPLDPETAAQLKIWGVYTD